MALERIIRCADGSDQMCTESGIKLGKEKYDGGGNLILHNPKNGEEIIAKWGIIERGKFYEPCQNDCTITRCQGIDNKKCHMCRRKMTKKENNGYKCGYYAEI